MFSQSREIHRQLRLLGRRRLFGENGETGIAMGPLDDKRVAMMFQLELFHTQALDAMQRNPISALLSIAWTLSLTSHSIVPQMRTRDYLAVWSPLICLVNTLRVLQRKFGGSEEAATPLFQLDDLRVMDREFFERLTERGRLTGSERDDLALQQTNSELFESLLAGTPFGTYQITEAAGAVPVDETTVWVIGGKRYEYVASPLDVRDRRRYLVMYERHETAERLRRQLEHRLRDDMRVYHQSYGVHMRPWMIGTHERETNGSYAMLWQVQKSALVWMFYHALAGLVTLIDEPLLREDFVVTVRSLENFIECGLCHHHWTTVYLKRWTAVHTDEVDVLLLRTHNDIQSSIDPAMRLTDAAIQALREDYLNVARCVATALSSRTPPQSTPLVELRCTSVLVRESKRRDVCREGWELWSNQLQKERNMYDCDRTNREFVKRSLLQLQWDSFQ